MNVGENIKALCAARGIAVSRFEKALGLSGGYVKNIAIKGSMPSADKLKRIAEYFGIPEHTLLGQEPPADGVVIPVLGKVAAGLPITAVENVIGQEEITPEMAMTGEYFALRVSGDSMAPNIHNGDIVIVRQQDDADDGDIVIAIVGGEDGVCKRVRHYHDSIALLSDNPAYPPLIYSGDAIDSAPVSIIGKVVELRRSL